MVFAHLLTVTNRTEHYAQLNREGKWTSNPDFCYWDISLTELAGKTFGIVGLGNIGRRVAAIANAFGMNATCNGAIPQRSSPNSAVIASAVGSATGFQPSIKSWTIGRW